jgi:hypothetical protein
MRPLAFVAVALLLSACETATKEVDLEKEFVDRCTAYGLQPDTPDFAACLDNERQKRLVQRSAGRLY